MSSPFNEEKYKALLEGLEASEIMFSYVKTQSDILRLDSYYYSKEFLSDEIIISKTSNKTLKELNASLLSFGAYSLNNFVEYKDSGIPFIRGVNMKNGVLDFTDTIYIDEEAHKLLWKSEVKPNTVLLSMSGTIGDVAIAVQEYDYPMNSNQDIAKIRLKEEDLRPCYLYAFLRSKYGQNFLKREARGSVQQHVFLSQIETIRIPLLNDSFQLQIERLVKSAHSNLYQSKVLYSDAENMLLSEIGLKGWQPNNFPVNIKQLKESFLASGRLDAEYYQSKYDEIEKIIKTHHYDILDNLCLLINHGMQPPYIEDGTMRVFSQKWIKDKEIDYSFIDDINEPRTSEDFAQLNPDYVCRKFDIVHYSVGANIGYCHTYLSDVPMMPGSFITLIRANEDKIDPIYLGVVLNSIIGRIQSEKRKSGTAQPYVYPKDIKEFLIPILPKPIQDTISAKIQESFALKAESKRLLEEAKMMVEREIEKIN